MSHPAAPSQPAEGRSTLTHFQRRLAISLLQTAANAIVVEEFAGKLYRATAHSFIQQVGVSLMFVVLVGSLTRMWFLTIKSRNC